MDKATIIGLIFGISGIILLVIGLVLKQKSDRKKRKCTMETTGEVIDYTFFSNNGLRPPIVKFTVNGKMYTAKLTYTAFSFFSSSFVKRTEVKGDKLDTVFRMKRNKYISMNPMVELFPLGSKLRVIYNPSKPEQNYVERWDPNKLDIIFMSCGVTILIGGIILYFLIK